MPDACFAAPDQKIIIFTLVTHVTSIVEVGSLHKGQATANLPYQTIVSDDNGLMSLSHRRVPRAPVLSAGSPRDEARHWRGVVNLCQEHAMDRVVRDQMACGPAQPAQRLGAAERGQEDPNACSEPAADHTTKSVLRGSFLSRHSQPRLRSYPPQDADCQAQRASRPAHERPPALQLAQRPRVEHLPVPVVPPPHADS